MKNVYERGFNQTTLADIAEYATVPLGNVYYYFRTKEALGKALVDERTSSYRALRATWDNLPNPKARLFAFIQMTVDHIDLLVQHGCPIGSLCQELSKNGDGFKKEAANIFAEFLVWLEAQFCDLIKDGKSFNHAIQLLAALQGATLLSHSLNDTIYIVRETARLKRWINQVSAVKKKMRDRT